jgi:hypothetical protein
MRPRKLSLSPYLTGIVPSKRPTASFTTSWFSSPIAAAVVLGSVSQARVNPATMPSASVACRDRDDLDNDDHDEDHDQPTAVCYGPVESALKARVEPVVVVQPSIKV